MRDLIKEFIDVKIVERGVAINTAKSYSLDLVQFKSALCPVELQEATTEDIENYLNSIRDANVSPRTIARKMSCIREFYKFLQSENSFFF